MLPADRACSNGRSEGSKHRVAEKNTEYAYMSEGHEELPRVSRREAPVGLMGPINWSEPIFV